MIRTRFAPSPTGFIHVGGIRTALYAFLTARASNGQFVLRLEDTDQKREVTGAAQHIIDSLRALHIDYDEGPNVGGAYAPYVQSERLAIYQTYAQRLINSGRAYADPYSPAEIQAFRDAAADAQQPFLYRNHRPDNPPPWDGHQPLRFKSAPKDYHWHDAVMGDLSAGAAAIDDFILMKSDGFPTYNFAHIVDDLEMKITHVIRGQEFIASTPNYLNLYEALDVTPPIFATLPPILNETGNKKLSKRDNARDVLDYLRAGFLVEALDNFIASLGWNDGTEQEIFSMDELIAKFSLDRVQKSGARFDEKRLTWLNGQWMRRLDLEDLYGRTTGEGQGNRPVGSSPKNRCLPPCSNLGGLRNSLRSDSPRPARILTRRQPDFSESRRLDDCPTNNAETSRVDTAFREGSAVTTAASATETRNDGFEEAFPESSSTHAVKADNAPNFWGKNGRAASDADRKKVLAVVQDRLKTLADLPTLTEYFFVRPTPDWSMVENDKQLKKLSRDEQIELLEIATKKLTEISPTDWNIDKLQMNLNELLSQTGSKPAILFSIIRYALTWAPFSPGLPEIMTTLGRDETLSRLQHAIDDGANTDASKG
jgi:glutamyl-tRNA synthetase